MKNKITIFFLILQSAFCAEISKDLVINGIKFNCNCKSLPEGWAIKQINNNWMQVTNSFPPKNFPTKLKKWCPRGDSNSHVPKNGRF